MNTTENWEREVQMGKTKAAAFSLALLVAMTSVATAQRGGRGEPPAREFGPRAGGGLGRVVLSDSAMDRFAERMELSEGQRGQLQNLADAYRSENADVLARMENLRDEMRTLREGDERPTRETLAGVFQKYDHPDLELRLAQSKLDRNVRSMLTPEQQRRFARGARADVRAGARFIRGVRPLPGREWNGRPGTIRRPADRGLRRVPRRPGEDLGR